MFWPLAAQEPAASVIPVEDPRGAQDQAIQERLITIFSAIFCITMAWRLGSWVGNRESWFKNWG